MYALLAWDCGRYEKARQMLDGLGGELDPDALRQFNVTKNEAIGSIRACTGPLAAKVRHAEELDMGRKPAEALPLFEQALAETKDDEPVAFYLRDRIAALRVELAVRGDQWVSWMPDSDFPGWARLGGQWAVREDGSLEGRTGEEGVWLVSRARIEGNFEIRGEMELDPRKEFLGRGYVALGQGSSGDPVAMVFLLEKQSGVVAIAKARGSVMDMRLAGVGAKNALLVQVWESHATAYVNGMPVFVDHQVPDDWWVRQGGRIELGSTDRAGAVVRFRNLQIRGLKRNPAER
jgi:hypothetical protein